MRSAEPEPPRPSKLAFRAAGMRLALAALALTLLPLAAPQPAGYFWTLSAYFLFAAAAQLLVWKQVGPQSVRASLMGLVDFLAITYVVHQLGSAPSLLFGIYILVGILYALTVAQPVAVALSVYGATLHAGLLYAEHRGLVAYAPGAPDWIDRTPPAPELLVAAAVLGYLMCSGSTLVVARLASTLRAREQELDRLSKRDPLTGLYNRRHLLASLDAELARVRRGDRLAVILIDLDGFKRVNDQLGHLQGDELLEQIAAGLAGETREVDVAGRHGGDEFMVLMPSTSLEAAGVAANRLLLRIRELGRSRGVTASLGVTAATAGDDAGSLLHRADEATYAAKRAGGDRVATA